MQKFVVNDKALHSTLYNELVNNNFKLAEVDKNSKNSKIILLTAFLLAYLRRNVLWIFAKLFTFRFSVCLNGRSNIMQDLIT